MEHLVNIATSELEREKAASRNKPRTVLHKPKPTSGSPSASKQWAVPHNKQRQHNVRILKSATSRVASSPRRRRVRNEEVNIDEYLDKHLSDLSFAGKTVVITGASSGIGLETMRHYLQRGATVINGDITPPAPEDTPDIARFGIKYQYQKTDVRIWSDVVNLFAPHKHVDIVVANAGVGEVDASFFDDEALFSLENDALDTVEINLLGTMRTIKMALNTFRNDSRRSQADYDPQIILLSSTVGYKTFGLPSYSTSKHAIIGLLRGMRDELSIKHIRLNALAPKWTQTPMTPENLTGQAQSTASVARGILFLSLNTDYHGKVLGVVGGHYHELEDFYSEAMSEVFGMEYP